MVVTGHRTTQMFDKYSIGIPKQHDILAADGAGGGVVGNLPRQRRGNDYEVIG
jgi:hypothetical protein